MWNPLCWMMETPLLGWSRLTVNSVVFPHELVINRQLLLLLRHSQAVCPTSSQQPFMFCICICVYIVFVFVYLCGWKYVEMFCGGDIKWKWNSECSHCFTEASPPLPSEIWKLLPVLWNHSGLMLKIAPKWWFIQQRKATATSSAPTSNGCGFALPSIQTKVCVLPSVTCCTFCRNI